MGKITPNDTIELWKNGVEFSHAWFEFADDYARQSFADVPSLQAQDGRRIMMVVDLWAKLGSGELLAFGDCVSPDISDGPVLIPAHNFQDRPPFDAGNSNTIEISRRRYERVRVCRAEPTSPQPTDGSANPTDQPRHAGGRPDTYGYAARVLKELYQIESNRTLLAEKLHPIFVSAFEKQFPSESYQVAPPSIRTLRNHLKRFRQEWAETGRN